MNLFSTQTSTRIIQTLIILDLVFTISTMAMDIWSLYLESHLMFLKYWVNNVNILISEPATKVAISGHLFICCIQCIALTSLFHSASEGKFTEYRKSFMISFYLLSAEYGIFLAYLVLTWNHYLYLFITLTFMSLAYKTFLCYVLYEFQQVLLPPLDYIGETYVSNINLYHIRLISDVDS